MNVIEIEDSSDCISVFTEFLITTEPSENLDEIYEMSKMIRKIETGGMVLYKEDLELLKPHKWLNDRIINAYMELLREAYKSVYTISTYIYQALKKENIKTVASWFDDDKLIGREYIIIPINENYHWTLIVINGDIIEYYDSLGGINIEALKKVKELFCEINIRQTGKLIKYRIKLMNKKFYKQRNSDDCGIFCCMLAKYRISPNLIDVFKAKDTKNLRKQMLHELLADEIIYK